MSLAVLLTRLRKEEIELQREGDELKLKASRDQVTDELIAEIRKYKTELLELLTPVEDRSGENIPRAGMAPDYPVTYQQRSIWVLSQSEEGSRAYNVPLVVEVGEGLTLEILENAIRDIIERHEVFRTSFFEDEQGALKQRIDPVDFSIEPRDATGLSWEQLQGIFQQETNIVFDLSKAPLIRAVLLHRENECSFLLLTIHHIIIDGISIDVLQEELVIACEARRQYRAPVFSDLPNAYKDLAVWQEQQRESGSWEQSASWWQQVLEGELPLIQLGGRTRPPVKTYRGKHLSRIIPAAIRNELESFCITRKISLFTGLLAGLNSLIYRYTGATDVLLGTITAGREQLSWQSVIGLFINTLPVRTELSPEASFENLLQHQQQVLDDVFAHQQIPFGRLVELLNKKRDAGRSAIFDILVVYNDKRGNNPTASKELIFRREDQRTTSQFDIIFSFFVSANELAIDIEFNTDIYDEPLIVGFTDHYCEWLSSALSSPQSRIDQLTYIPVSERDRILNVYAGDKVSYPGSTTIVELFREQVQLHGGDTAVVYESERLSYAELDARSEALGRQLRSRGVRAGSLVALCLERSVELVVGILGILKAGGAYVPVDPHYPAERIGYILNDIQAGIAVTDNYAKALLSGRAELQIINLEEPGWWEVDTTIADSPVIQPADLAYIIYTSGSTGTPKGVMIEHRQVVRLFKTDKPLYDFTSNDVWTMFHSYCFDFSVWEIFGALLYGGRLVMVSRELTHDVYGYGKLLSEERVTVLNQTPQSFYLLSEVLLKSKQVLALRYVIFGGEALDPSRLSVFKQHHPDCRLINMYGITETTVHVTFKEITAIDIISGISNIGRPIPTLYCYVLDENRELAGIGVPGELYVGGAGLARGYLHRAELTVERFIQNLWQPGERLYKTGDLVRWLEHGELEYLGRRDDQVKIRGYRIELGEVEHALQGIAGINGAVVTARRQESGVQELVSYVVGNVEGGVAGIRRQLQSRLPEYMIPSYIIELGSLPLTVNGKVDRRRLPSPEDNAAPADEASYEAPQRAAGYALISSCEQVLRRSGIGMGDHFFELGGDSIKAILLAGQLKQRGYKVKVGDILRYPLLRELEQHLQAENVRMVQQEEEGAVALTPVQHWYLQKAYSAKHHYNQSILLYSKEALDRSMLEKCLQALVVHHDALRMVFNREENGWIQYNRGNKDGHLFGLEEYDLLQHEQPVQQMGVISHELQGSMDLGKGPLLKAGLFHLPDGDRLLLVAHHLVVDGVSWRILLEDLSSLYAAWRAGRQSILPAKTHPFRHWSAIQSAYANEKISEEEIKYWQQVIVNAQDAHLPPDKQKGEGAAIHAAEQGIQAHGSVQLSFSEALTDQLLTKVNQVYGTETPDILLTALGLALPGITGSRKVLLEMEGHGREDLAEGLDTTRTVGWFTSLYPLVLETGDGENARDYLVKIKEQLRHIPSKGIGYGMLRYLREDRGTLPGTLREADITFNYLGDLGKGAVTAEGEVLFSYSEEYKGEEVDKAYQPLNAITVTGLIIRGSLRIYVVYNKDYFHETTMEQLAAGYSQKLEYLIHQLSADENKYITPSDLSYKGLTVAELNLLNADGNVEDVYEMSPSQEGIYYHWLSEPGTLTYVQQLSYTVAGNLDIDLLRSSYEYLVNRHAILRTSFHHQYGGVPVQAVHKYIPASFYYEALPDTDQEAYLHAFKQKDWHNGFVLDNGSQMRLSVMKRDADGYYEFIWTHHHILMDGWCVGILVNEFYTIYNSLSHKQVPPLPPVHPYADYINWQSRLDQLASRKFWKQYLQGYEAIAAIPYKEEVLMVAPYIHAEQQFAIEADQLAAMREVCGRLGITENTFIQSAWGYLLGRYNNTSDVVFGAVVSGRPDELAGVEQMIGLFINTVPVRVQYNAAMTIKELLKQVQQEAIEGLSHHFIRLSDMQAQSSLRNNLFDHILVHENFPLADMLAVNESQHTNAPVLKVLSSSVEEQSNYHFNVVIIPSEEAFTIQFKYNGSYYSRGSVSRMVHHLQRIIYAFCSMPDALLSGIQWLSPEEQHQLITTFNDTNVRYASDKTLVSWFRERVIDYPDYLAVVQDGEQLTYRELDRRSNQLSHYLVKRGVTVGSVVPVCLDRSVHLVISLLGILKAGGAYVPVDPAYPQERISYMVADTSADLVITDTYYRDLFEDEYQLSKLYIDRDWMSIQLEPETEAPHAVHARDLAYIIYTSGSTGKPKGVMIEHTSMVNLVEWHIKRYDVIAGSRSTTMAGVGFDACALETWSALLSGSALYIVNNDMRLQSERLLAFYHGQAITHAFVPPALIPALVGAEQPKGLAMKYILIGGDRLPFTDVSALSYTLVNQYGPTESTVMVTDYPVLAGNTKAPLIGKPIANTRLYILDENRNLLPVGIAGEIYIGGVQLARGYWKQEGLSAERFVPDPFRPGEKLYRTGDLGRWLPDGNMEYLQRTDDQVKIRGYRIELGEVEYALISVAGVREAVVITREKGDHQKELIAYIVADGPINELWLLQRLHDKLPGYMVPAHCLQIERLPLTANGKVDKKALPLPEDPGYHEMVTHIMPRNEKEEKIVAVWREVLQYPAPIGVHDDFFVLGGHSLHIMQLLNQYYRVFNVRLTVQELFDHATVETQAQLMAGKRAEEYRAIPLTPAAVDYEVSDGQRRLWALGQVEESSQAYHLSGQVVLEGDYEAAYFEQAIHQAMARHEVLRTVIRQNSEGVLRQVVLQFSEDYFRLEKTDMQDAAPEQVLAYLHEYAHAPFDLGSGPLLRAVLIQLGIQRYLFHFTMHHIISDGWSMELLREEVMRYYNVYASRQPLVLSAPPAIQYKDYAAWQQQQWQTGAFNVHKNYWLKQFAQEWPLLSLPSSKTRPAVMRHNGFAFITEIDPSLTAGLRSLCREYNCTIFMGLLSVLKVLLYRYTAQDDIVVGTAVAGRDYAGLEEQIGFYANTLPLRTRFQGSDSFADLLQQVQQTVMSAYEHQQYPFDRLVEDLALKRDLSRSPLFDIVLVLQNQQQKQMADALSALNSDIMDAGPCQVKYDWYLSCEEIGDQLRLYTEFNTDIYDKETIIRALHHYRQLLSSILVSPQSRIDRLDYLQAEERQLILEAFAGEEIGYPKDLTMVDLFREQVRLHGSSTAVVYEGVSMSYAELDARSEMLARQLYRMGIGPGSLVALCLERSAEMVVGILGILKTGGAYVPIDPQYPAERIGYMLSDTRATIAVTDSESAPLLAVYAGLRTINLERLGLWEWEGAEASVPQEVLIQPEDLAYIIYTSGSTGLPKGVMTEHRQVVRLFKTDRPQLDFNSEDVWTMFHSYCFDFSTWEIFGALLHGGRLVMVPRELTQDVYGFARLLVKEGVTILNQTPQAFYMLSEVLLRSGGSLRIRYAMVGGEAVDPMRLAAWRLRYTDCRMFNIYGPTETTVIVGYKEIKEEEIKYGISNIGRPMPTNYYYVLDNNLELVGLGVPGELYVGGAGLARGYLHRAALTAERFIPNPWREGERLYRTGDVVRWLDNGDLEYRGRSDGQVKIRGYRVELGEVEHALQELDGIRGAAVIAHRMESGVLGLVGYVAGNVEGGVGGMRAQLQAKLPEYMIPSYIIELETLPLTVNGKVDRRRLPSPEAWDEASREGVHEAPQSAAGHALVSSCEQVLKRSGIGMGDNFFDMGGDSIKAILLSGQLKQRGYKLKVGDILRYPSLREMEEQLQAEEVQAVRPMQEEGEAQLTPVQHWFFKQAYAHKHHYNQSILLYSKEVLQRSALEKCLQALVVHHDALRMVFKQQQNEWQPYNRGNQGDLLFDLEEYDLLQHEQPLHQVGTIGDKLQRSIELENGPLIKACLFHLSDGDRLLLVAHHLVVDGVSWRILLEDLSALYAAGRESGSISERVLPAKTDSFRHWSSVQSAYAREKMSAVEITYWQQVVAGAREACLPLDKETGPGTAIGTEGGMAGSMQARGIAQFTLSEKQTEQLLTQINRVYGTDTPDVLLAALGLSLGEVMGSRKVLLEMEGHGREELEDGQSIARTVGWFTSLYPVLLETPVGILAHDYLVQVKEQLRRIPSKGIGYGMLRYLREDGEALLGEIRGADITFNYLGDFGKGVGTAAGEELFSYAEEYKGEEIGESYKPLHAITVTGVVTGGCLRLYIDYNKDQYHTSTMDRIAASYQQILGSLISELSVTEKKYITPSDLSYKGLSMEELSTVNANGDLEDVYAMSPLQEGIYYHWLAKPGTTAYVEQMSYSVAGKLDIDLLRRSYEYLVDRHAILRTSFHHQYGETNLQVIRKQVTADFRYEQLTDQVDVKTFMAAYKEEDRRNVFDLNTGSQMRLTVLQYVEEHRYEFIWTHHHILMDGWCVGILMNEFYTICRHLANNQSPVLTPVYPYADYINWLSGLDLAASTRYWQKYLNEYEQLTPVPFQEERVAVNYTMKETDLVMGGEWAVAIKALCASLAITESSFIQSAWGYLLGRYNNTDDVVFGAVVSGRPGELHSVEQMIGLFINTVPVRIQYGEQETIREMLQKVQQAAIGSLPHHYLQLSAIQSKSLAGNRLFDHILVFENYPVQEIIATGLGNGKGLDQLTLLEHEVAIESNYPFTVQVVSNENEIRISFLYQSSVYSDRSVDRIKTHFAHVIDHFSSQPDSVLRSIPYLSKEEDQRLMVGYNETLVAWEPDRTVDDLLQRTIRAQADQTALRFGNKTVSYKELDQFANQIAAYLLQKGIQPGNLVAIKTRRTEWTVLLIAGILRSGAAYVPVDPAYPAERIDYIIKDSDCRLVIDEHVLSDIQQQIAAGQLSTAPVNVEITGENLAYVIYTSGSTGFPKGVMIKHSNLYNYVCYCLQTYFSDKQKRYKLPLFTSLSFDLTVTAIFGNLLSGGELVIYEQEASVRDVLQQIFYGSDGINFIKCTPAHVAILQSIQESQSTAVDHIIVGGEALTPHHITTLQAINPGITIYNEYGPTEATVGCVVETIQGAWPENTVAVPIGKPVANVQIYVLDKDLRLVAEGLPGELCIGGAGVAPGYLNRPSLTAEKFIDHPFRQGEKVYRTGDLARWSHNGTLEYLGRIDEQLKIRGYRVEPGEIEHVLTGMAHIQACVVTGRETDPGELELVAYVVSNEKLDINQLLDGLREKLPAYMVPGYIVQLDSLPLTPNGKVDKKELPAPKAVGVQDTSAYTSPRNEYELKIAGIWQDILKYDTPISITANFFALGGHSLRVMQLGHRYYKEFNTKLSIQELFDHATIEAQAALIVARAVEKFIPVQQLPLADDYAVSDGQRRLWVLSQVEASSRAYHLAGQLTLVGAYDVPAFEQAIQQVIDRHEILRTIFIESKGELRQVVLPPGAVAFTLAQANMEEATEKDIADHLRNIAWQVFDLAHAPLLRAGLLKLSSNRYLFYYTLHHIISDGWSMNLLGKEIMHSYAAKAKGEQVTWPALRIQYKEYAAWQQEQLRSASFQLHRHYWLQQFSGELPVLDLPASRPRPSVLTTHGAGLSCMISPELTAGLQALCRQHNSTLFMGLISLIKTLFYRYTGQEDIIIGSPVAGRGHTELESQIGFYVNTIALRTRLTGVDSFETVLQQVRTTTLAAYEHQMYPFDRLVEELQLKRDMSRSALFDVFVNLENVTDTVLEPLVPWPEYQDDIIGTGPCASKFDLILNFHEEGGGLAVYAEYNSDIYDTGIMVNLLKHFRQLLAGILAAPGISLQDIDYLPVTEKRQLLENGRAATISVGDDHTVLDIFRKVVQENSRRTALRYGQQQVSYAQLDNISDTIAWYLTAFGDIQPGDLVGIKLPASDWTVMMIMGVVKAGAAWLPLDMAYPKERLEYIIADSGCKLLVDEAMLEDIREILPNITIPDSWQPRVHAGSPAYVIYTSGSTGRPKGVIIKHENLLNYMLYSLDHYFPSREQRYILPLFTSIAFDLTITSLWGSLLSGGELIIYDQQKDMQETLEDILYGNAGINWIKCTPAHIALMEQLPVRATKVKQVIAGGEALKRRHLDILHSMDHDIVVHNEYGPTETTVGCIVKTIQPGIENKGLLNIPIGTPIYNTEVYILDKAQLLVPVQVSGELYIGGAGVGAGYLNKAALTTERFVEWNGARVYRTGDVCRWLDNGDMEYLGRTDEQVKIRGYRIEPGEIEHTLTTLEGVQAALVVARTAEEGQQELIAYIIAGQGTNPGEVRMSLQALLPEFMIPGYIIPVDHFPLTANGKIDKKALPAPEASLGQQAAAGIGPRNEVETIMAGIWKEVLKYTGEIGVEDDFFILGGHSLRIMQLGHHYYKNFEVKLSIQELFLHKTIAAQAALIAQKTTTSYSRIEKVPDAPDYPVSDGQRRLWVLSQLEEGARAYHLSGQLLLEGTYDPVYFEQAILHLVDKHEILRTVFSENDESELRQVILPAQPGLFSFTYTDAEAEGLSTVEVQALIQQSAGRSFNLAKPPLIRVGLIKLTADQYIFHYTMHHIISDGWSMKILSQEVLELYTAFSRGLTVAITPLRIQYKDYAGWQLTQLGTERYQVHRAYWLDRFAGVLPVLQLPSGKTRPPLLTHNGFVLSTIISGEPARRFRAFCQEENGTLFMGLLTLLKTLLYRYTGQEDIIVGSPAAGRNHSELENQIGFYVNTLVLRTALSGRDSFAELFEKIRTLTLQAYEHQLYPFDRLVDELELKRDISRSALFDVFLNLENMQNAPGSPDVTTQSEGAVEEVGPCASKFDMVLNFHEEGDDLRLYLEFNTDIYEKDMMIRFVQHYKTLLGAAIDHPHTMIDQLEYMSGQELQQVQETFNNTAVAYEERITLLTLFRRQVAEKADLTALLHRERSYSYRELDEYSNQLALYLQDRHQVAGATLVAVALGRSERMIITLLAILKTGAAYVPVDPAYPEARIAYLLADSGCKICVDEAEWQQFLAVRTLYATNHPTADPDEHDLAYVLYTSGSSGNPKGCMLEHKGVVNRIEWMWREYAFTANDVVLQKTTFTFDVSVWEIFMPLCWGCRMVLCEDADVYSPERIIQLIEAHKVTCLHFVPGMFRAFIEVMEGVEAVAQKMITLRRVITSGEALELRTVKAWYQTMQAPICNLYGPTEASIDVSYFNTTSFTDKILIGKPVANTTLYILDDHGQTVPVGIPGELYIGGVQLARGYWDRPELTAEKFIVRNGQRLYRTGDLGRWQADGNIDYLGRIDDQVKIRGNRVELGEIEHALLNAPGVEGAVVVARDGSDGNKELVAYIISDQEPQNNAWWRRQLLQQLPEYMVPALFINMEEWPLTANGKIDKKRLPYPDDAMAVVLSHDYLAPRNEVEKRMVEIWQQVLGKQEAIGVRDDFFALGGHSIKAIKILSKTAREFGITLNIRKMFEHPTIEQLSNEILNHTWFNAGRDTRAGKETEKLNV